MSAERARVGLALLERRTSTIPMYPYPWKVRMALPCAVLLAVLLTAGWSAREVLMPATDVRVAPVVMLPVSERTNRTGAGTSRAAEGDVIVQAAGWIEPDPHAVAVSALTDGVVREVLVVEGQRVAPGQVLARLIDDDAKLTVQRAEAVLAASEAELLAAERHWENPVERDLAVATARAQLVEARAERSKLDSDIAIERARVGELTELVARTQRLTSTNAASEVELIVLQFKLQAQQATLSATEARRGIIDAQIERRVSETRAAEAAAALRIEESRAVALAKAGVAQAQTSLAEAQLRLLRTEVRSPIGGVVMNRMTEPGAKLLLMMDSPQSAYVARLFDPTRLQVRVDVPLADVSKLGVGTAAQISVEALPGKLLRGEVTRIVHEADVAKNTLQFKVRIDEPPAELKPEMLARVRFVATGPANTPATGATNLSHRPFVPELLVQRDGDEAFVMLADAGHGRAIRRKVTTGSDRRDGWVVALEGVSAGDRLIADPTGVADGSRIRIVEEAPSEIVTGLSPRGD